MNEYYRINKNKDAAMQYVVQAAYWSARTRGDADGNDKWVWWKSTISAFDRWRKLAPVTGGGVRRSARGGRMATEAEYALVNEELLNELTTRRGIIGTRAPRCR